MKAMLDSMATSMFRIVIDGEEPSPPGATPSYEWRCILNESVSQEAKHCNPHVSLEVVGEKANLRKEKLLDRKYFTAVAAEVIQKAARGFLVRIRRLADLRNRAALTLQCKVRQIIAKRRLKDLKTRKAVATIRTVWAMNYSIVLATQLRMTRAGLVIQKHWRGLQTRAELKALKKRKAAFVIWAAIQSMKARCKVAEARKYCASVVQIQHCFRRHFYRRSTSAQSIQKSWLRHITRGRLRARFIKLKACVSLSSLVEKLKSKKLFAAMQVNTHASVIAATVKSYLAYTFACNLRRENSACVIQAKAKGYLARRQLNKLKIERADVQRAVLLVQKISRGFLVRAEHSLRVRIKAAVAIQRAYRRLICWRYLAAHKRRRCTTFILQMCARANQQRTQLAFDRIRIQQELTKLRQVAKLRLEAHQRIAEAPAVRLANYRPKRLRCMTKADTIDPKPKQQTLFIKPPSVTETPGPQIVPPKAEVRRIQRHSKELPLKSDKLFEEIFIKPHRRNCSRSYKRPSRVSKDLLLDLDP